MGECVNPKIVEEAFIFDTQQQYILQNLDISNGHCLLDEIIGHLGEAVITVIF